MKEERDRFERSAETRACLEILRKAQPGEVIEWSAFEKELGFGKEQIKGNITSARRIVQAENDIVFGSVRGIGIRRLLNPEHNNVAAWYSRRCVNDARRGTSALRCTDYEALEPKDRVSHNTWMTILTMQKKIGKGSTQRVIENAVQEANKILPIGRALKVLGIEMNGKKDAAEGKEEKE